MGIRFSFYSLDTTNFICYNYEGFVIAENELILLNENNHGRQLAVNRMAENVKTSDEVIEIKLVDYLQNLQRIIDEFDSLLKLGSSLINGIDIIKDNFPSNATSRLIEYLEKNPKCYAHEFSIPCCDDCKDKNIKCCEENL